MEIQWFTENSILKTSQFWFSKIAVSKEVNTDICRTVDEMAVMNGTALSFMERVILLRTAIHLTKMHVRYKQLTVLILTGIWQDTLQNDVSDRVDQTMSFITYSCWIWGPHVGNWSRVSSGTLLHATCYVLPWLLLRTRRWRRTTRRHVPEDRTLHKQLIPLFVSSAVFRQILLYRCGVLRSVKLFYTATITDFLNIINLPFLFKNNISETGFYLHPEIKILLNWAKSMELVRISEHRNANRSQGQSQSYFTTGGLPPISSSWVQTTWDPRPEFFFSMSPCGHSPYVTSSLTRRCVSLLWICFAFRQAYETHL
jgi:hypothetical protein